MRPQAPELSALLWSTVPPVCCRPAPRISTPVLHVVGTWGGSEQVLRRLEQERKERHHLCVPTFSLSPGVTAISSIPRDWTVCQACLEANMCSFPVCVQLVILLVPTTSGRSPGLPGDHRAAPDPGRPRLEAVVPKQQSSRRSATSHGCKAQDSRARECRSLLLGSLIERKEGLACWC